MPEGTTVVLGWDGLDHELATEFGLAEAFGHHHKEIDTFDNEVLGTPHTAELWPSIITGVTPDEHGIHAVTEDGGATWSNPAVDLASDLAQHAIPDGLRTRLGVYIRNYGATIERKGPEWYANRGVSTMFDGRASRPIAIPSYHHPRDDACGILADRGAELSDFLDMEVVDGQTSHSPDASLPEIEERLTSAASQKLGIVRTSLSRDYDIVFVWLAYIDTIGHLEPAVDSHGWQERAYHRAAEMTDAIRNQLEPEDNLVCVADHGLRDGEHTHQPLFGADDSDVLSGVDSVLDVRDGIERVTPASGDDDSPAIREASRYHSGGVERDATDVQDQLENLGYL